MSYPNPYLCPVPVPLFLIKALFGIEMEAPGLYCREVCLSSGSAHCKCSLGFPWFRRSFGTLTAGLVYLALRTAYQPPSYQAFLGSRLRRSTALPKRPNCFHGWLGICEANERGVRREGQVRIELCAFGEDHIVTAIPALSILRCWQLIGKRGTNEFRLFRRRFRNDQPLRGHRVSGKSCPARLPNRAQKEMDARNDKRQATERHQAP